MITRRDLAKKLIDYLQRRITLEELVDWAERALMEEELDEQDHDLLRDALARLGVADVKAFGLTWDELEALLSQLGYHVELKVTEAV